jgi:DNA polymerase I
MMFQPEPGMYEKLTRSILPHYILQLSSYYNLSPETIEHPEMRGFLSAVLSSLLNLRIETNRQKKPIQIMRAWTRY